MVAAMAEAEKVRAAGDAYKRELLQAKLAERDGELGAVQDALKTAKREAASARSLFLEAFCFMAAHICFQYQGHWGDCCSAEGCMLRMPNFAVS